MQKSKIVFKLEDQLCQIMSPHESLLIWCSEIYVQRSLISHRYAHMISQRNLFFHNGVQAYMCVDLADNIRTKIGR